jgi:enoyl-CoA hydratase
LVRLVGLGRALELLLTGDQITAQRACEMGLVNAVHPQAELLSQAEAQVTELGLDPQPVQLLVALP